MRDPHSLYHYAVLEVLKSDVQAQAEDELRAIAEEVTTVAIWSMPRSSTTPRIQHLPNGTFTYCCRSTQRNDVRCFDLRPSQA